MRIQVRTMPLCRLDLQEKEDTVASTDGTVEGVGVRDLLEAGLHFGHQTKRWNPKMKRYIFDKRNGIHIVDLSKSLSMLRNATDFVHKTIADGRSILFVGTKKQAQKVVKETAVGCHQHFVTTRWLGGTLTNNATIRRSIRRMKEIQSLDKDGKLDLMHKKEAAGLRRELEKLFRNLEGIAEMNELPGALFIIDVNREAIAVAEANRLNIPVIAIVDTNCDPDPIQYVIPGNDDAIRAIALITKSLADAVNQGASEHAQLAAEIARKREAAEAAARQMAKAEQASKSETGAAAGTAGGDDQGGAARAPKAEGRRGGQKRPGAARAPAPEGDRKKVKREEPEAGAAEKAAGKKPD
jgi:small subunit ribosomal protein S2